MPKNFNVSNNTVSVGPRSFTEQAYVDDEGDLTGLDKTLESAAALSSDLVVASFNKKSEASVEAQEEMYSKARQLKRQIYDAGLAGDQQAELQFQSQLEDLKIAERQGAINGTNSQVRQETLLKSYINRYPHLEDRFRKAGSATRARAEASRSQFEDPIEEGIDQVVKEATAAGMTVGAYLNVKKEQQAAELDLKDIELRSKLGVSIENDVDNLFQSKIVPLSMASFQRFIAQSVENYSQKGIEFDANKAKADFLFRAQQEASIISSEIYNIVKASPNPNATLSREFVEAKRQQILSAAKQVADSGVFESFDTLNSMKRAMEIGTQQGLRDLAKFSPLLAEMVKLNPKDGFDFVYKDFAKTLETYRAGRRAQLKQLASSSAADPITSSRLNYQISVIDAWGQGELAKDVTDFTELGTPPVSSGDTGVDAAKTSILTKSVLQSTVMDKDQKANAVKAALDAEDRARTPLDAPGPSSIWYKDPTRRRVIQTNEKARAEITKRIDNAAAVLFDRDLSKLDSGFGGLQFAEDLERENPEKPWESYPNGGPFGAPSNQAKSSRGVGAGGRPSAAPVMVAGPLSDVQSGPIGGLNRMYWAYRYANGREEANLWARDLITQFKETKDAEAKALADEGKKNGKDSQGPVDIDLTD